MSQGENFTNQVTNPANEFFAQGPSRPLFWRPRFQSNSPILSHTPFLFWLAGIVRPRRSAVLGAGDGTAFFLFCQAMDKLNSSGFCQGLGFWQDETTGDPTTDIPEVLEEHVDQFYDDMSVLTACEELQDGFDAIAKNSLDVLFVDLEALPEDASVSITDCLDLLKETSVLILHGTAHLDRRSGGEKVLINEISRLPKIAFGNGAGLTVFPRGDDMPVRLRGLLEGCENGAIPIEFEAVFRRLGQGLDAMEQTRVLKRRAAQTTEDLAEAQTTLKKRSKALNEIQAAYEIRNQKVFEAQSATFDLQTENESLKTQVNKLTDELTLATSETAALAKELDEGLSDLKSKLETADTENRNLAQYSENERRERFSETAALTKRAEQLEGAVKYQGKLYQIRLQLREKQVEQLMNRRRRTLLNRAKSVSIKTQIDTVSRSEFFDAGWYLDTNPDVKESGINPAEHFVMYGFHEGRQPSEDFDLIDYLVKNPALLESDLNPLVTLADRDG